MLPPERIDEIGRDERLLKVNLRDLSLSLHVKYVKLSSVSSPMPFHEIEDSQLSVWSNWVSREIRNDRVESFEAVIARRVGLNKWSSWLLSSALERRSCRK